MKNSFSDSPNNVIYFKSFKLLYSIWQVFLCSTFKYNFPMVSASILQMSAKLLPENLVLRLISLGEARFWLVSIEFSPYWENIYQ